MRKLSVALLVGIIMSGVCSMLFAGTVTIHTQVKYVPGDGSSGAGTPTALYVSYTGGTSNTQCRIKTYFVGDTSTGWIWKSSTSTWIRGNAIWDTQPTITTNGSGNWSGWIYSKFSGSGDKSLRVRVRDSGSYYNGTISVTAMDMSTNGAWIQGGSSGNPPAGYVVLAYSSNDLHGAYAAENNGISEGYELTSGYWKLAVYTNASITKLEARDSSNNVYATDTTVRTAEGAGTTTTFGDASLPVILSSFAAIPTDSGVMLKWRTESEVDNLGWDIYRGEKKDGKFVKINDKLIPGAGNSAMPNSYQFVDKTAIKGRQYYYYLKNVDIAGMRNKSLITSISKGAGKLTTTWGRIKRGY